MLGSEAKEIAQKVRDSSLVAACDTQRVYPAIVRRSCGADNSAVPMLHLYELVKRVSDLPCTSRLASKHGANYMQYALTWRAPSSSASSRP